MQLHTAAVFVTVDNAPVRASVADAQFYVQWMDNLLTNTSPGGVWSSYFPTNLAAAQARYQAAKATYQQIASEAPAATAGHHYDVTAERRTERVLFDDADGERRNHTLHLVDLQRLSASGPDAQQRHGSHLRNANRHRNFSFTVQVSRFRQSHADRDQVMCRHHGIRCTASFTIWPSTAVPGMVDDGLRTTRWSWG